MLTKAEGVKVNRGIRDVLNKMGTLPITVVACVEGDAIGGGCELALACDRLIVSERARFSFRQGKLGLTPGWGGGPRLLARVKPTVAHDWLRTGRWISAQEAFREGLVDEVVPSGETVNSARNYVEHQPHLDPKVLVAIKRLCYPHAVGQTG